MTDDPSSSISGSPAPGAAATEPACPPQLDIDVIVEEGGWRRRLPFVETLAREAATDADKAVTGGPETGESRPRRRAVALLFTNDRAMRDLNRLHRGQDRPTNVLAFPAAASEAELSVAPDRTDLLGEIALGLETAIGESERDGKPLDQHVAHLVVHGMLHLLGFDHQQEDSAVRMEELEADILAALGVPDPYADNHSGTAS